MKQIQLFIILFLFGNLTSIAQTVTNLRFEQSGKMIDVYYDLSGKDDESFQIKLYCSLDEGKAWGTSLYYVTGAVGEKIKPGNNKKITWDVIKEKEKLVGEVKFKIEVTPMSGCYSFTITHKVGIIAPVTKTVTYGVVETNLTGSKKCWITQNLGSDRQPTVPTDASEASAGWYWQFNRKQGYISDGTSRSPNTTWISYINENSNWLLANDPCNLLLGNRWRLPTITEWENADATSRWNNYNETFVSALKLHAAGNLNESDGSLYDRGSTGYYWSSSQYSSDYSRHLNIVSSSITLTYNLKAYGFTLRCLRD